MNICGQEFTGYDLACAGLVLVTLGAFAVVVGVTIFFFAGAL